MHGQYYFSKISMYYLQHLMARIKAPLLATLESVYHLTKWLNNGYNALMSYCMPVANSIMANAVNSSIACSVLCLVVLCLQLVYIVQVLLLRCILELYSFNC